VYRDVFKKGDLYFSSGDLLTVDDLGYVYFKDRTGDTFRWKGENVSTTEVESVVASLVGLSDVVCYGVSVPGCEGRAGMASIAAAMEDIDMRVFYDHMRKSLPPYAVPLFVRLNQKMETTGTFKLPKVSLQKEGYDPNVISDPLFFLDVKSRSYQKLDDRSHEDILSGKIRF
jgi:solute carrier family 27 fatty acid transporter 1/4